MTRPCATPEELALLIDGELTENRAALVRAHVEKCAACRGELESLTVLLGDVAHRIDPRPAALERVMARLDEAPPASPRSRWGRVVLGVMGAAAAAAIALVHWAPAPRAGHDELTARGGPAERSLAHDVGVSVYRSAERLDALVPGEEVHAGTSYAVAAVNLGASGSAYLMVFAQDAANDLHWIEPGWRDPSQDPEGTPLAHAEREAPPTAATVLDQPAPGSLHVFVLVTPRPVRVSEVERLGASPLDARALRSRWPDAVVDETVVHVAADGDPQPR